MPLQIGRCCEPGKLRQIGTRFDGKLAFINKKLWLALRGNDGKAERKRRVGNVLAANIEHPRDRGRIGEDSRAGATSGNGRLHFPDFVLRLMTCETGWLDRDFRRRHAGLVVPNGVDKVDFDWNQDRKSVV